MHSSLRYSFQGQFIHLFDVYTLSGGWLFALFREYLESSDNLE